MRGFLYEPLRLILRMRNFVGVLDLNWQGWYSKRCEMATGGLAVEDALFQQARSVRGAY